MSSSAGRARANVQVSFTESLPWIEDARGRRSSWTVDLNNARFWFEGVAGFEVAGGSRILIAREPGIDESLLRMYVEGMMMATVLFQRGYFVLHASVVSLGDACVAFIGNVGAGKSSTAAALHARGHAVLTDDNAAIDLSGPQPMVTPAFPYVKIFPAIGASLGYAESSLTRMHSSQPKYTRDVGQRFPSSPLPLGRIYVLTRDAEAPVQAVPKPEAPIELIRNSVPSRWKIPGTAEHLRQCASLAARIPMHRVRTFETLDELPALAERIENHRG